MRGKTSSVGGLTVAQMPITEHWWTHESEDKRVQFDRVGDFDVLTQDPNGHIGVIGTRTTTWYREDSVHSRVVTPLARLQLPLLSVGVTGEVKLKVWLKKKALLFNRFAHQYQMFDGQQGALFVVLTDVKTTGLNQFSVDLAVGFTIDELIPAFKGNEVTDRFSIFNHIASEIPEVTRMSRYQRPWVI